MLAAHIGLCQKSDDFCHDGPLGEDFHKKLPEKGKFPKWLGEGAKGLLDPGSNGLPRVFCTGATPFCTGASGFLLAGSERPVAPSPNHF